MGVIAKSILRVWELTKIGINHTCIMHTGENDNQNLSSKLIGKHVLHLVRKNPDVKCSIIRAHIHNVHGIQPTYKKCWLDRSSTIDEIFGD